MISYMPGLDQLLRLTHLAQLPIFDPLYWFNLLPAIAWAGFVIVFVAHLRAAKRRRR